MDLTPLSLYLFTLYLLTSALLVLCMYYGWAALNPCFCWKGSFTPLSPTPLPSSDCLSLLPGAQAPPSPSPSITEPFTELNQLTYLAKTFFCWVSGLNWCRISSNRHGGERECRCLQQEGWKVLEDTDFLLWLWWPAIMVPTPVCNLITSWYLGTQSLSMLSGGTFISNTTPSAWNKVSAPMYFQLSTARLASNWTSWQSISSQCCGHIYGHSFCQYVLWHARLLGWTLWKTRTCQQ